ncbi:hypothetical protein [Fontibacter flavus]|uniref:Uncharacterized protein n=1 Tax=Fontibacter flavus TaxID=654838 RepID=A0ABV6FTD0_9BACT|nr:hypothetical protein [Cyclobacteriaceae bacterium]
MTEILHQTAIFLKEDFSLPEVKEALTEENLVHALTPVISRMLDREFERLLNICYRIDLGESKLKKILHESDPEHIAADLARALVKRQIQKIEIRQKYSQ